MFAKTLGGRHAFAEGPFDDLVGLEGEQEETGEGGTYIHCEGLWGGGEVVVGSGKGWVFEVVKCRELSCEGDFVIWQGIQAEAKAGCCLRQK